MLKNGAKHLLRVAGLEIRRVQDHPRNSLTGVLSQLCRQGICPATVIDVGAAFGSWSQTCAGVFPQATYCLIEPIAEYEHALQQTTAKMPNAKYHIKAISNEHGEKKLFIHPDLVGSSFKEEHEPHTQQASKERMVPCWTIDQLCDNERLASPFLLKLDIQGAELEAITGAKKTLQDIQAVIMEVSLLECMKGAPSIAEVVHTMQTYGFIPYDLFGHNYRPLDNALTQVDMVFVPISSPLLSNKWYANKEQRIHMNQRFMKQLKEHGI